MSGTCYDGPYLNHKSAKMFKPELWQKPIPSEQDLLEVEKLRLELERRISQIAAQFPQAKFASSLAVEDMVITDVIARLALPIEIFTLDTGKLNAETLALIPALQERYPALTVHTYTPLDDNAKAFDDEHGLDAMYKSLELRRQCCHIRKIEPLNRALADAPAWLSGQRREQSSTRADLAYQEHDAAHHIRKFNPLYDWTEAQVWAYAIEHELPLNNLYEHGYPSIGCEPCTRPIKLGEDIRAGRWWWENSQSKECGLHK